MAAETIVSLTPAGHRLGVRIAAVFGCEHLHRPKPFADIVRERYRAGHRLAMITATGIAIRVLAPIIVDKRTDPAVLVLDENARFVIPLISGHEGGGNDWGRAIAAAIGAVCVITTAKLPADDVLVAGMGCERGCPESDLARILHETMAVQELEPTDLTALASIELKRGETGLLALAGHLGLPVHFYGADVLARYTNHLSARSEVVYRETGCYGVAEAAALAHAESVTGGRAELLVEKRKGAGATCAIARSCPEACAP